MDNIIENLRDKSVQTSIKNLMVYRFVLNLANVRYLFVFSITILIVPLASMFLLKMFLFEGRFLRFNSKRITLF